MPRLVPSPPCSAAQLRGEIQARAQAYARSHRLLHELSPGRVPGVIFGRDEQGRHGNFHPAADAAIRANPEWSRRLAKPHTASRRSRPRKDWRWMELDSAVSSDALLMNIFCHPGVYHAGTLSTPVAALLGVVPASPLRFGALPGVPLATARKGRSRVRRAHDPSAPGGEADGDVMVDRTEIDLAIGDPPEQVLIEAKLNEGDFQTASPTLLRRYRDLPAVFDLDALPRRVPRPLDLPANVDPLDPTVNLPVSSRPAAEPLYVGYQLIRNVLAAYAGGGSFCLLLDARRTDLIEAWYTVLSAVHAPELRWRLKLLTWQELAARVPHDLQCFLEERYGIRG
ncbi:MAG: hypothetical protein M3O02_03465 [Acidobacteriota bacterium]|nr:hypothetical protein [Acidobacteriota bacterium]